MCEAMALGSCFGSSISNTTFKARTFLQPQLHKAVPLTELTTHGSIDGNPKDHILFGSSSLECPEVIKDNTGRRCYDDGVVFPTPHFSFGHALVMATLRTKSEEYTTDGSEFAASAAGGGEEHGWNELSMEDGTMAVLKEPVLPPDDAAKTAPKKDSFKRDSWRRLSLAPNTCKEENSTVVAAGGGEETGWRETEDEHVVRLRTSVRQRQRPFRSVHAADDQQSPATGPTTLNLRNSGMSEETAKNLGAVLGPKSVLTSLEVGNNGVGDDGVENLAAALGGNHLLQKLGLGGNQITQRGVQSLAKALEINDTLVALDLRYNAIGEGGTQRLAAALAKNLSLRSLDLQCNNIGANGLSHLTAALGRNSCLEALRLRRNSLGDRGAELLGAALPGCLALSELDLRFNGISGIGAAALAVGLVKNRTLKVLDLWNNNIGDAGVVRLAHALGHWQAGRRGGCHPLQRLLLGANGVGPKGAAALGMLLEAPSCALLDLDVSHATICDEGAASFAQALEENRTLTRLGMERCGIAAAGAKALLAALGFNRTLLELDISCNQLDCGLEQEIAALVEAAIRRNRTRHACPVRDSQEVQDKRRQSETITAARDPLPAVLQKKRFTTN
eukprot:gnl/TRDRNA2_/TRDRNA2_158318_c2_seq1.p1 gnl/TRDRNA2_/TRDRNA2_158318_c2~~gnl/TRDRNA2_/TRDRNA2_158318_c2_seq1.p1  ORF type:complete len:627 (+),score=126.66 gnl/TRDRNA2_/TRDRNA2_158318_c2_seq1:28-1881(+)